MAKRILFVLHGFAQTGAEGHTRDLARGLGPDYEAGFVFPFRDQVLLLDAGYQVLARYPGGQVGWPETEFAHAALDAALQRAVDAFRPDLLHIQHLHNWPLGALARLVALGLPTVLSLHDYYLISPFYTLQGVAAPEDAFSPEFCRARFGRDLSAHLGERRERLAAALAGVGACVAPSRYLAATLARIFTPPLRVIEHGIELRERLPPAPGSRPLRFAFFGGMYEQKGWQPLLAAFAELRRRHGEGVELQLYGSGYPADPPPHPGISVHGVFEQQQLPQIMAQISVGVIPSLFPETFSLALSEFWHFGIPVAVADIGALGERVRDGVDGRKFAPGDVAGMLAAIEYFVVCEDWRHWSLPPPRSIAAMADDYRRLYAELGAGA